MRIGVDLGGTKTEAIALGADGRERWRRRVATPARDYEAIVRTVAELVRAAEAELGQTGTVGVGTPGAISPATGLLKNSNTTCLNGRPFDRDLAAALGRPVRLANDANCFALSEATDGAAAGAPVVFGAILGTGTGGGVVVDGRVLVGPNAVAGEWGHNPMPWPEPDEWPGPACYCGRTGCLELFLCGAGRAAAPERYASRLARGLAAVVNVLDPDVIVLGGGVSNVTALYEEVPRLWGRWIFSDRVDTRLARSLHGDSSGVRGAAWLWPG